MSDEEFELQLQLLRSEIKINRAILDEIKYLLLK